MVTISELQIERSVKRCQKRTMEIDFQEFSRTEPNRFLTHVIVPRPFAWAATLLESGALNTASFSFFNVFGSDLAFVASGIGNFAYLRYAG